MKKKTFLRLVPSFIYVTNFPYETCRNVSLAIPKNVLFIFNWVQIFLLSLMFQIINLLRHKIRSKGFFCARVNMKNMKGWYLLSVRSTRTLFCTSAFWGIITRLDRFVHWTKYVYCINTSFANLFKRLERWAVVNFKQSCLCPRQKWTICQEGINLQTRPYSSKM